jgi:hypothetical protein
MSRLVYSFNSVETMRILGLCQEDLGECPLSNFVQHVEILQTNGGCLAADLIVRKLSRNDQLELQRKGYKGL